MVVLIQRIRVRWGTGSRGSQAANRRRGLPDAASLPGFATGHLVVVHDVLMDEINDYRPTSRMDYGLAAAREVGLWLEVGDAAAVVDRLPGRQAYPRHLSSQRLFTVKLGQSARHRANFRFTACCSAPHWYYEQWTTMVAIGDRAAENLFVREKFHHDRDDRVHLYGGRFRRAVR